jgi:hypothetical protein
MRKLFSSTLVALALAAAAPVFAASQDAGAAPHVRDMTAKEFLAYHDRLDRDLDKKQFDYVTSANRAKIEREQGVIRKTLEGHATLDELDESARTKVFNAHESVVAIMNDAELDKVTCKREHKPGSHMGRSVCTSARERRESSEAARETISRNRTCTGADCNST